MRTIRQGLALSRVVNVTVNLSPLAAGYRNFGATLMLGDSDIIDTDERIREYRELEEVEVDFGTSTPEFYAADLFFSQSPQNSLLYIGRWARVDTHGRLHGAITTPMQQLISNFNGIEDGSMNVSIDGVRHDITGLDFTATHNLNGVASIVQSAIRAAAAGNAGWAGATFYWDLAQDRFTLTSGTTGTTSTVDYARPVDPAAGTDMSVRFRMQLDPVNTPTPIDGLLAETPVSAVATSANYSSNWYALMFAAGTPPTDLEHIAVAAMIEGQAKSRIYGVTTQETGTLDDTIDDDLASQLKSLGLQRTFIQYSASSPYAIASLWARQSTVNFDANNSTITLKFKQEPGIVAEWLTETQASTLQSKNCNVFVHYENDTSIIQEGVMCGGYFIDERVGADWMQNRIQVDLFNELYQAPTKVPQTNAGTHQLVTVINHSCAAAVNNGWVAPGQWNVAGFGQLNEGDYLQTGFYVFAPLVETQSQADRERRKAVPIQVALKLAGAIHSVNVAVTVNR